MVINAMTLLRSTRDFLKSTSPMFPYNQILKFSEVKYDVISKIIIYLEHACLIHRQSQLRL